MPRSQPGLAFSILCDLGFAVGIVTHDVPTVGTLVWVAEPTFDEQPTSEQARSISEWRWPILLPLAAAILVNDTSLTEKIVSGWRPENEW